MFGPRLNRVFASRANALWWSAMVLVTAYCVAADPPAEVAPAPDAAVAHAGEKSGDPWAAMKDVAKKRQELLR
ncbi:hypothetical protein [uncultured Parasphingorhabdus sp.]|uniref:hypothetical protein n=1 Tax=uncultured Parasphingorhabdus sp. TaxID=2709694 RepID=UPI0030DD35C4|tara:strand:- start:44435 stop:44653 length:219 start_codon:yes stop_codon:yes gene_type:complete